jgi:hypothetical protein
MRHERKQGGIRMTPGQQDELDALKQSLIKLATIANQLDARSARAVEQVEASTDALGQGMHRLESGATRLAGEALQMIGQQARQTITQGTAQALGELDKQLQAGTQAAQRAAVDMDDQRKRLARAQGGLVWKALSALTIGSLLAAGGSSYIAWKSMHEVRRAEFGQDILQATQSGMLTRCGGALCAKVGEQAVRYGSNEEYVLLVR